MVSRIERKRLENVFRRKIEMFFKEYGPQGWWPHLVRDHNGSISVRHHAYDQDRWLMKKGSLPVWEVVLGAVLTQNVAWGNVEQALLTLAKHDILTPEQILDCPIIRLGRLIRPARFYAQRVELDPHPRIGLVVGPAIHMPPERIGHKIDRIGNSQEDRQSPKLAGTLHHRPQTSPYLEP